MYDYIIVGSGLFGATFAYEAHKRGKKVLVLEKRDHIAGNVYTEEIDGIQVHKYGAHIFHTSNEDIWEYINQFATFNNYINRPIAKYKKKIYNLPFNMNTFCKIWPNISKPEEAKKIINKQSKKIRNPKNLEEQAISLVGKDIYKKLVKGYTEKQWGKKCSKLPVSIIKRLPVRYTFDNNYFNDKFQGIPIGGYTQIIEKMLNGIEVKLEEDYLKNKDYYNSIAKKIIYTGKIDEYYDYKYGELEYRSLLFIQETLKSVKDFQGNAVVNYTDKKTEYTRIIEHKHFENLDVESTIITREYPYEYNKEREAYYSINNEKNEKLYNKYKKIRNDKVIFCGRLGSYKYYDMDDTIESALKLAKEELK